MVVGHACDKSSGLLLCAALLTFIVLIPSPSHSAAPARSGQPYAESICNTDPNIIFCEDFNYPQNFFCSYPPALRNHRWINPGWAVEQTDFVYGCDGRQINPATTYQAKPQGAMGSGSQADYVWVANWDRTKGVQDNGGSPGQLRLPGGNYVNGSAPAKDFYVRFQVYWTANYAWPGDPKTGPYAFSNTCIDNKIVFFGPPEWGLNPTNASYDAGALTSCAVYDNISNARYADAAIVRVGSSSDNYKTFPVCSQCSFYNQHNEYLPYQHPTALRNPGDTPTLGKIFRFDVNRWYTVEVHYVLATGGGQTNGTVELWIDGTKVYSANDLDTCDTTPSNGDCSGLGFLWVGAYHNSSDTTAWNGQQIIDNLIVSRSYIGPPRTGNNATPSSPSNIQLQ